MPRENVMLRFLTASSVFALCLSAGLAVAQTPNPTSPSAPGSNAGVSGGARTSPSGTGSGGTATPTPGSSTAAQGGSSTAAQQSLSEPEVTFMKKAAASDMTEIETSRVALTKATRPEIKQFAQQMIDDHTKLSAQMQQLAQARGMQLPPRDPSVEAMVSKLNGLSGAKFDQEYVKGQVAGHRDASKLFHAEGTAARDPQLKQLVAQATPIIDQHLQHAEQLGAAVGVEAKTSLKK
jgi:putative membrane protein